MEKKTRKTNLFLLLLAPFKYFFLGVYYTLYCILYPFIIVYNLISSSIYKSYDKKRIKKAKVEVINAVNLEMSTIDEKIKKNNEVKQAEVLKVKETSKRNKSQKKSLNEKKLKERDILISEINKQESVRTEFPKTYKYSAKSVDGNDVTGYLVAFTKQEVFNFLESEGYTVYKLETNKFIELFNEQKQFSRRK